MENNNNNNNASTTRKRKIRPISLADRREGKTPIALNFGVVQVIADIAGSNGITSVPNDDYSLHFQSKNCLLDDATSATPLGANWDAFFPAPRPLSHLMNPSRPASHIIDVGGHGNNCGLFAFALGMSLADEEKAIAASCYVTKEMVAPNSQEASLVGENLRSQLLDVLINDKDYKNLRLHSFIAMVLEQDEEADMQSFINSNKSFINELNDDIFTITNTINNDAFSIENLSILERDEAAMVVFMAFVSILENEQIALDNINVIMKELHQSRNRHLSEVAKIFVSAWALVGEDAGLPAARNALKDAVEAWFLGEIDQRLDSLKNERFEFQDYMNALMDMARCYKDAGFGTADLVHNAKSLYVRYRVKENWEMLYGNYIQYVQTNAPQLSADELGALANHRNVNLTIVFSDGQRYSSTVINPAATKVVLCNPSLVHWQVVKEAAMPQRWSPPTFFQPSFDNLYDDSSVYDVSSEFLHVNSESEESWVASDLYPPKSESQNSSSFFQFSPTDVIDFTYDDTSSNSIQGDNIIGESKAGSDLCPQKSGDQMDAVTTSSSEPSFYDTLSVGVPLVRRQQ